jgi:hypothetical protein
VSARVTMDVRPFPQPREADMASLARVAVEQREYTAVLTRWERRLANRVMARIAKSLGIGSTRTRGLHPQSGGCGLLSDRRT